MKETKNFFAYGTLMCDEIMAEVSGVRPRPVRATLRGYRRLRVKAEPYPAVVPNTDYRVDGIVYQNVPPPAWDRLDRFEGEIYSREIVQVRLGCGSVVRAATYVLRPQFRGCLDEAEWDFSVFLREGKGRFRRSYKGYLAL
jgi:gamma-glutamylcyclotransferase (GGCT)/AIG2-like uncharacterized protein YtfP